MKKLILLFVVIAFSLTQVFSQESTAKKGDKILNLGIGFGSGLYTGTYYKTSVPPISASFEVVNWDGIGDKGSIGIGGFLGYSSHKWEYSGWGYKYSDILIAGRGVFHWPLVNKLDTYGGLTLGWDIATSSEYGNAIPGYDYNATTGGLLYAVFAGARYYFSDSFGVMGELGVGIVYLNLGVAFKF